MPANHEGNHHAIIVGAGQAGLAASYHLKQRDVEHILIDRGRPGEVWRTQRWDTFALNTPSAVNSLPGKPFYPDKPGAFESPMALTRYFDEYVEEMQLPYIGDINVKSAKRAPGGVSIEIETSNGTYRANHLIVASGIQNVPKLPPAHYRVPAHITSMHTADHRNPEQLPPGAVLIVGSAQSGMQVAEDLLEADRTVFLSNQQGRSFPAPVPRSRYCRMDAEIGIDVKYCGRA
jgi:putative flavoprotein involved in K+ transport